MDEIRNTVTLETATLTGNLDDMRDPKMARTVSCHAVYEWPPNATVEDIKTILENHGFTPMP